MPARRRLGLPSRYPTAAVYSSDSRNVYPAPLGEDAHRAHAAKFPPLCAESTYVEIDAQGVHEATHDVIAT
jgi:hypothetical protein